MTKEEINEIKNFINYCKKNYKYPCIDENSVFVDKDKETTKNVLNLIMKYETIILDYFSFTEFLKPLIKKLAIKLFKYGEITADDCLYYINISLR